MADRRTHQQVLQLAGMALNLKNPVLFEKN